MKRILSRRHFLKGAGQLAAGAVALPYFVPNTVFAGAGRLGANDRIGIGQIGVGGMGRGQMDVLKANPNAKIVAVCDVDKNHLTGAAKAAGTDPAQYSDFRKLLEDKNVDGVLIASPDHWHAIQTVLACQAGKDVYCQKPACNTIAEGRAMVEAVKRYARVVQVGSQGRSMAPARAAGNYIRNGMLGKVSKVTCWHPLNPDRAPKPDSAPPPELDWDMWLGPAAWRPYNPDRAHFWFRYFLDLGGGNIRDRGSHIMSLALWFMDADNTGPVSVEATGEAPKLGLFDAPTTMQVTYEFKNPDWTLVWGQPGDKAGNGEYGSKYWGDKDTLVVDGGDGATATEKKALDYQVPSGGVDLFQSPGHEQNWLDCMRTRRQPLMHIEAGCRVAALCNIGNIAYKLGRKLQWDPVNERFVGDDQANLLLSNPGRGEWHLS